MCSLVSFLDSTLSMMSPSSSDTSSSPSTLRSLARYGLYLVGAMVVLWVVTRAAAMQSPSSSAPQSTDSTMVASSPSTGDASSIDLFTWGNGAALLLLLTGGAYALYLRQQYGGTTGATDLLRPLGQLALGQSNQVRLVECGGEVLLLGVTDDDVTLLKTYSRDAFEDLDAVDASGNVPPSPDKTEEMPDALPGGFSEVLRQFVERDARS